MLKIEISAVHAQTFSVNAGDSQFDITIKLAGGAMIYDVYRDDEAIMFGARLVTRGLMLPYRYQMAAGNFLLAVPDDELPDYNQFGQSQFLYYLDNDDLADLDTLMLAEGVA